MSMSGFLYSQDDLYLLNRERKTCWMDIDKKIQNFLLNELAVQVKCKVNKGIYEFKHFNSNRLLFGEKREKEREKKTVLALTLILNIAQVTLSTYMCLFSIYLIHLIFFKDKCKGVNCPLPGSFSHLGNDFKMYII